MLQGFASDPNQPGCEKVVATNVNDKWLDAPRVYLSISDIDVGDNFLAPSSVFMVKGWNRVVCATLCMLATYELVPLQEARQYSIVAIHMKYNAFKTYQNSFLMFPGSNRR